MNIHPDIYKPTVFADITSEYGIPAIAKHFMDFKLVSETLPFYKDEKLAADQHPNRTLENIKMRYVYGYLKHPEFMNLALLKTTNYDHVVYAIFAYILQWSEDAILRFGKEFRDISTLINWIIIDKKNMSLVSYRGYPVTPRIYRILSWHFEHDLRLIGEYTRENCNFAAYDTIDKQHFTISKYVSYEWVKHFQFVYDRLRDEAWNEFECKPNAEFFEKTRQLLGVPFAKLFNHRVPRSDRPKYITGVACCGKTTVLEHLRHSGWRFESRGSMGTFSGKSKTPALVASLHAAIDDTLRSGSRTVIGDRGPIDNPLWTVIMQLCDPKHSATVVSKLLQFFEATFNEPVIRYHSGFDVVVFLDQYPSRNRERMRARNDGGDVHRARLQQYVTIQFMAYYMFAVLFGFRMIFVPYDRATGNFDGRRHTKNAQLIAEYYGPADTVDANSVTAMKLNKELPEFMDDNTFPIVYGIFK